MEDTESCSSRALESLPSPSRKRRQKVEVYHEVLRRLKESEVEEASRPGFEDELWNHFTRLPLRYQALNFLIPLLFGLILLVKIGDLVVFSA